MAAALWRMALRGKALKAKIEKLWGSEENVKCVFVENHEKFAHLTDAKLSAHAKETRDSRKKQYEQRFNEITK